ncbi:MAG: hypothetical protein WC539_00405 [Nitrospirota bacterium]
MKNRRAVTTVLAVLMGMMFTASAYAEITNSAGLYFRLRHETWDNVFNFQQTDPSTGKATDDDNYFRLKTSVWDRVELDKKYAFYVKLTNEARYFFDSSNTAQSSRPLGFNKDEIFFDNVYVSATSIAGLPVDAVIGRQDLMYGEGFILMDGTPGDGSRSFYYNAAKTTVKFWKASGVDLIYITDQTIEKSLPMMSSSPRRNLTAYNEEAAVVYGKIKEIENLSIEPYYVWKTEYSANVLRLNTVGSRVDYSFDALKSTWRTRVEYAHQFGSYDNGMKREADGGFAFFGGKHETLWLKPSWEVGYVYLSGDKANSPDIDRGWNPLFSRYPWFSELYCLSLARESGGIVAYWSNLQATRAAMKFVLLPTTTLDISYTFMRALENSVGTGIFSVDGKQRGHLYTAKLYHQFSKSIDGYLLVENFVPGNYYAPTNRDSGAFIRWELQWKI